MTETETKRAALESKLGDLEEEFSRSMRERGFDPAQIDNVPLTPAQARIQSQAEEVRNEILALGSEEGEKL
jgi:hypothetical protein